MPLLEQRALVRDSRASCTLSVCQDGKEASLERWSAERAMVRTSPTAFFGGGVESFFDARFFQPRELTKRRTEEKGHRRGAESCGDGLSEAQTMKVCEQVTDEGVAAVLGAHGSL